MVACAQMALLHIGIRRPQSELNRLLGLTQAGIPAPRIRRLAELGAYVEYEIGDEHALRGAVDRGFPLIAFLITGDLPYWAISLRHAVLVVGYDDAIVYLNDPAFSDSPKHAGWGDFLLAWSEFDYRYAQITAAIST